MESEEINITTSVLISYAYGMLVPDLARKVKHAIETDEVTRWEYEGILQLIKNNPDEDPMELLEQMAGEADTSALDIKKPGEEKKRLGLLYKLILAAVIVFIIFTGFYMLYQNYSTPTRLALSMIKNAQITSFSEETRGSHTGVVKRWQKDFEQGKYGIVIQNLQSRNSLTTEEQFFLAASYLKQTPSQPQKAEPLLRQLVQYKSDFTSDAWLYLGLTQTLLNQNEQAIQSLRHVVQTAQVKDLEERLRK